MKKNENHIIPKYNYETNEKYRIPYKKYENHENPRIPLKKMKIMKLLELHMIIKKPIRIFEFQWKIMKIMKS